jgi:hypothetical protein
VVQQEQRPSFEAPAHLAGIGAEFGDILLIEVVILSHGYS